MGNSIVDYFISLVQIDSESKQEKDVALKLEKDLTALGAEVKFDKANEKTGGNIGNLYAYLPGKKDKEPILFCAHMDTVKSGIGIKPQILKDRITSDGTTILGSDDKSGIAQIFWAIKEISENHITHAPIEIVFTVSEEKGLLGSKNLDYSLIKSKFGFALDSRKVGSLAIGAPSENDLKIFVHGKEAHAGVEPEKGLNAIKIAAEAITKIPLGRIDEETTCNIGKIEGGKATNIIPNYVKIEAEVRSHSEEKLQKITQQISSIFKETASKYQVKNSDGKIIYAKVEIDINKGYQSFRLKEDDEIIKLGHEANKVLDLPCTTSIGGGGSDANNFNQNAIKMAIVGTGMNSVHTVDEFILISDLEKGAQWIKEVIRIYSQI
ncbi:MAG: M20/M25/M40 family metallo-hydrolase [Armatimonadetes bacterium]|nr:M20/M25/M40 family metallo-hydrolase [Armatimonadota bacterium]